MQDVRGKTAVVTGAASGIGLALATRLADEGMNVVLADVEEGALNEAVRGLTSQGAKAVGVPTDVSEIASVRALAEQAADAFGNVHVLCNNAGVGAGGPAWDGPDGDWQWVLGVNLWGVINGVRTFLPAMLAHGEEAHIVNTASILGLVPGPFQAAYTVSKYGVVGLTEALYYELKIVGAKVGVSVLCPAMVSTRIVDSARNRPQRYGPGQPDSDDPAIMASVAAGRAAIEAGLPPPEVAATVFDAIKESRLYVLTHPDFDQGIRDRMETILAHKNPVLQGFA